MPGQSGSRHVVRKQTPSCSRRSAERMRPRAAPTVAAHSCRACGRRPRAPSPPLSPQFAYQISGTLSFVTRHSFARREAMKGFSRALQRSTHEVQVSPRRREGPGSCTRDDEMPERPRRCPFWQLLAPTARHRLDALACARRHQVNPAADPDPTAPTRPSINLQITAAGHSEIHISVCRKRLNLDIIDFEQRWPLSSSTPDYALS